MTSLSHTDGPEDDDQAWLDRQFAALVAAASVGRTLDLDALASERPHLADRLREQHALAHKVAVCGPARLAKPPEVPGFRILGRIGEGGMGAVFLAEQTGAVRRQVALKVIKLGMDTGAVLARFELERQALALMAHSSIAKVFEAGATTDGRPYFAMEYVKGIPITR